MQPDTVQSYKQKLVEMRARLTSEIGQLDDAVAKHAQVAGDLSHLPSHPADRDSEGIKTSVTLEHAERRILNQVEAALRRIDKGAYGRCQDCHCEIPRERLDAVTYATCCVPCEEKRERTS